MWRHTSKWPIFAAILQNAKNDYVARRNSNARNCALAKNGWWRPAGFIVSWKTVKRKIRRLVDANILGITTWNVEGAILASNEAFLRMVQYDHEDVTAGRVRWRDMTPADWRERC